MIQWIKLGGQERPITFGHAVAYGYEAQTGGNYNELLFRVASEMDAAGQAVNDNDLARIATAVSVKPLTDLIYFGLKHAHRKEGVEINFDVEDVAEWVFGDQDAMQQCVTALFESLPKADGTAGESATAKKKTVSRPGSNGKGLSKRLRQ